MLYDEFHTPLKLDPKGRLTLPASLRADLKRNGINQLVVVANQGNKGGLSVFTPDDYARIVKGRVAGADPFAKRTIMYLRAVSSTSQTVGIDGNGRILVPPLLRKLAGLDRELVAFSSLDWFEIWDEGRWDKAFARAMELWDDETGDDGMSLSSLPAPGEGA